MDSVIAEEVCPPLPPDLLALERELRGSDGRAALTHYDSCLISLEQRLQSALARGVSPGAYQRCAELQTCVTVARKCLRLARQSVA